MKTSPAGKEPTPPPRHKERSRKLGNWSKKTHRRALCQAAYDRKEVKSRRECPGDWGRYLSKPKRLGCTFFSFKFVSSIKPWCLGRNPKLGGEDAWRIGKRGPGGDLQDRPYAESWKAAGDTELKLRRDVNFSDGDPFTAKDFAGTLCRLPLVQKSPSPLTIYTKGVAGIETSEFIDCAKPLNIVSAAASDWPERVGIYRGRLPSFAR